MRNGMTGIFPVEAHLIGAMKQAPLSPCSLRRVSSGIHPLDVPRSFEKHESGEGTEWKNFGGGGREREERARDGQRRFAKANMSRGLRRRTCLKSSPEFEDKYIMEDKRD